MTTQHQSSKVQHIKHFGQLKRSRFEWPFKYRQIENNVIRVLRIIKSEGLISSCLVAEYAAFPGDLTDKIIEYLLGTGQIAEYTTILVNEGGSQPVSVVLYCYKRY